MITYLQEVVDGTPDEALREYAEVLADQMEKEVNDEARY